VTDLFSFFIKMTMVTLLAFAAVHAVGGMGALKMRLALLDQARGVPPGGHVRY